MNGVSMYKINCLYPQCTSPLVSIVADVAYKTDEPRISLVEDTHGHDPGCRLGGSSGSILDANDEWHQVQDKLLVPAMYLSLGFLHRRGSLQDR